MHGVVWIDEAPRDPAEGFAGLGPFHCQAVLTKEVQGVKERTLTAGRRDQ